MPKLFAVSIILFLLLGAGYGAIQAARSIPWDCSDWQAFAHDDRTTVILESLAENRGKTLYCGIDQSDTFTKAETWAAGKDRNERDDTVYWGERGSFRGFIAAQEGWLTEGESGITGQSIATIFEFPKEQQGRRKKVKRFEVGSGSVSSKTDNSCMTNLRGGRQPGTLLCTDWTADDSFWGQTAAEQKEARNRATGVNTGDTWREVTWDTNIRYYRSSPTGARGNAYGSATPNTAWWQGQAAAAANSACRARGARPIASSVAFGPGHSEDNGGSGRTALNWIGTGLGFYLHEITGGPSGTVRYQARQSRTWSATCKKVIRRNR